MIKLIAKKNLKKIVIGTIIIAICLFCFISIFIAPSYMDELNYHYPLAQGVSLQQAIEPGSDYSSAYPPLPYFAANLVLKISNTLIALRFLNYVVFLLAIWSFYQLAKKLTEDPLLLTLLFFLNPYLLKASYMFYLTNWGLLFVLLGLYCYFGKGKEKQLSGDFCLLLAVLSQQWMLVVVLAILLYQLDLVLKGKLKSAYLLKSFFSKLLIFAPALYLFYSWRGLTHPNFGSHSLRPTFEHVNGVLANIGLVMFFIVLANYKKILEKSNLLLIFPLPLLWLAVPGHSMMHGPREITGVVSQLATKLNDVTGIPYECTMFFFIVIGYLFLVLLLSKNEIEMTRFYQFAVLGFFIAFAASSRLAASHIFISLPMILLLFHSEIAMMKKTKLLMILQYLLLSSIYIIYVTFFRSRGIII